MGAHKRSLNLAAFVAAMLLAASPARGQHVRGVIRDETTGDAVAGAVVWLSDSTDRFLSRSVSRDSGLFDLPRLAESTRLHVLRIGYRPLMVPISPESFDTRLTVSLTPLPLQLAAVQSHGRRVCPGDSIDASGLELWVQARSALFASIVARETQAPTITLYSYTRVLEPIRHRIVEESSDTKQIVADRSYVAARPASVFAHDGYLRENVGGVRDYFAPDEAVMFDSTFVETHCLRAINGERAHQGQVGVGFDPIFDHGRDTLVDVQGVLWMDIQHPHLVSLEYTYTGLEPAAVGSGGEIKFRLTPGGTTMIESWQIHAALLADDEHENHNSLRRRPLPRTDRRDIRVVNYLHFGGQLVGATGGSFGEHGPRLVGRVVDIAKRPVAGARVWLRHGADTVRTNDDGSFVFSRLPPVSAMGRPGVQVVSASDSLLASVGISRTFPEAVFVPPFGEKDATVQLVLQPRALVLPIVCPVNSYRPGVGVVLIKVLMPDGTGAPNAHMTVLLDSTSTTRAEKYSGTTDEQGNFSVCGAAIGRVIRLHASQKDLAGDFAITNWTDEFIPVKLMIARPAPLSPQTPP